MHKIGATLLASASLSACGTDNPQVTPDSPQNWRLVKADWWLLHSPYGSQVNSQLHTFSFEYDNSAEITRVTRINLSPAIGSSDPAFVPPEENSLSFESYRFFNTSSSNWDVVGETFVTATQDSEPEEAARYLTLHTFESWGDTVSVTSGLFGDWSGVNTELNPDYPAPSDFYKDYTDFDSDIVPAPLPTTQRQYNNGKVNQVLFFDSSNEKPFYRQVINYENHLLSNIQQARSIDSSSSAIVWQNNLSYSYIYPSEATAMVEITIESPQGKMQSFIASATYEKANCGPMTKERSLKMVPQPFAFCITR